MNFKEFAEAHDVQDYAIYSNRTEDEIRRLAGLAINWKKERKGKPLKVTWEPEDTYNPEKHYAELPKDFRSCFDYLCAMYGHWHINDKKQHVIYNDIVSTLDKGAKILDFGGGSGTTSLFLLDAGFVPTYHDPHVPTETYAIWRFKRHGYYEAGGRVGVAYEGTCDAVVCIDVLEHVRDPLSYIDTFKILIKPGGYLFISTCFSSNAKNPDHLLENAKYKDIFGGWPGLEGPDLITKAGFVKHAYYKYQRPR